MLGSLQRHKMPALSWRGSGRGRHVRTCTVGSLSLQPERESRPPAASGSSKAPNSEGGWKCRLRPAEHLGVLQGELLSVRRPGGTPSLASSLSIQPDGHQMAPGLVAASQGWTWLSVGLLSCQPHPAPHVPPGSSRSRAPSTVVWTVGWRPVSGNPSAGRSDQQSRVDAGTSQSKGRPDR